MRAVGTILVWLGFQHHPDKRMETDTEGIRKMSNWVESGSFFGGRVQY